MEVEDDTWGDDLNDNTTVIITPQLGIRGGKVVGKEFTGSYREFFSAAEKDDLATVTKLLREGADPDRTDWMNLTILHSASEKGFYGIVDILIRYGADIHKLAIDQKTNLHLACEKGHFKVASALINAGANLRAKDRAGDTPLHLAVKKNRAAIVALLLAQDKTLINIPNKQGKKPTDFPAVSDTKKLLTGEIEDPILYSGSIFASLDNDTWEEIQNQISKDSESEEGSEDESEESSLSL
eukprot:TRINITY_DN10371_c0_g1_i1.p1 TRINITY_DN10371_c0_g1~~TRINITY_DN10371_c0_g1_i1.p1  ORF type:complete len:248 (-),score=52.05 TRINITY_DN10371_c0_g1_i1:25-744(-)